MAQGGHLVWPGGPRARVVLLCRPGRSPWGAASEGLWDGGQGGRVGRAAEGASAALACGSGGPTGRGEMRDGRVSWGGVGRSPPFRR